MSNNSNKTSIINTNNSFLYLNNDSNIQTKSQSFLTKYTGKLSDISGNLEYCKKLKKETNILNFEIDKVNSVIDEFKEIIDDTYKIEDLQRILDFINTTTKTNNNIYSNIISNKAEISKLTDELTTISNNQLLLEGKNKKYIELLQQLQKNIREIKINNTDFSNSKTSTINSQLNTYKGKLNDFITKFSQLEGVINNSQTKSPIVQQKAGNPSLLPKLNEQPQQPQPQQQQQPQPQQQQPQPQQQQPQQQPQQLKQLKGQSIPYDEFDRSVEESITILDKVNSSLKDCNSLTDKYNDKIQFFVDLSSKFKELIELSNTINNDDIFNKISKLIEKIKDLLKSKKEKQDENSRLLEELESKKKELEKINGKETDVNLELIKEPLKRLIDKIKSTSSIANKKDLLSITDELDKIIEIEGFVSNISNKKRLYNILLKKTKIDGTNTDFTSINDELNKYYENQKENLESKINKNKVEIETIKFEPEKKLLEKENEMYQKEIEKINIKISERKEALAKAEEALAEEQRRAEEALAEEKRRAEEALAEEQRRAEAERLESERLEAERLELEAKAAAEKQALEEAIRQEIASFNKEKYKDYINGQELDNISNSNTVKKQGKIKEIVERKFFLDKYLSNINDIVSVNNNLDNYSKDICDFKYDNKIKFQSSENFNKNTLRYTNSILTGKEESIYETGIPENEDDKLSDKEYIEKVLSFIDLYSKLNLSKGDDINLILNSDNKSELVLFLKKIITEHFQDKETEFNIALNLCLTKLYELRALKEEMTGGVKVYVVLNNPNTDKTYKINRQFSTNKDKNQIEIIPSSLAENINKKGCQGNDPEFLDILKLCSENQKEKEILNSSDLQGFYFVSNSSANIVADSANTTDSLPCHGAVEGISESASPIWDLYADPTRGIRSKIKALQKGEHFTLFGYGFSGSGKTFLLEALMGVKEFDYTNNEYAKKCVTEWGGKMPGNPSLIKEAMSVGDIKSIKIFKIQELYGLLGIPIDYKEGNFEFIKNKEIDNLEYNIDADDFNKPNQKFDDLINNYLYLGESRFKGCLKININYTGSTFNKEFIKSTTNDDNKENINNLYLEFSNHLKEYYNKIENKRKQEFRIKTTPNNKNSSRSHLFVTFEIIYTNLEGQDVKGYLTFCDMAGAEKPDTITEDIFGEEARKEIFGDDVVKNDDDDDKPVYGKGYILMYPIRHGPNRSNDSINGTIKESILDLKNTALLPNGIRDKIFCSNNNIDKDHKYTLSKTKYDNSYTTYIYKTDNMSRIFINLIIYGYLLINMINKKYNKNFDKKDDKYNQFEISINNKNYNDILIKIKDIIQEIKSTQISFQTIVEDIIKENVQNYEDNVSYKYIMEDRSIFKEIDTIINQSKTSNYKIAIKEDGLDNYIKRYINYCIHFFKIIDLKKGGEIFKCLKGPNDEYKTNIYDTLIEDAVKDINDDNPFWCLLYLSNLEKNKFIPKIKNAIEIAQNNITNIYKYFNNIIYEGVFINETIVQFKKKLINSHSIKENEKLVFQSDKLLITDEKYNPLNIYYKDEVEYNDTCIDGKDIALAIKDIKDSPISADLSLSNYNPSNLSKIGTGMKYILNDLQKLTSPSQEWKTYNEIIETNKKKNRYVMMCLVDAFPDPNQMSQVILRSKIKGSLDIIKFAHDIAQGIKDEMKKTTVKGGFLNILSIKKKSLKQKGKKQNLIKLLSNNKKNKKVVKKYKQSIKIKVF